MVCDLRLTIPKYELVLLVRRCNERTKKEYEIRKPSLIKSLLAFSTDGCSSGKGNRGVNGLCIGSNRCGRGSVESMAKLIITSSSCSGGTLSGNHGGGGCLSHFFLLQKFGAH